MIDSRPLAGCFIAGLLAIAPTLAQAEVTLGGCSPIVKNVEAQGSVSLSFNCKGEVLELQETNAEPGRFYLLREKVWELIQRESGEYFPYQHKNITRLVHYYHNLYAFYGIESAPEFWDESCRNKIRRNSRRESDEPYILTKQEQLLDIPIKRYSVFKDGKRDYTVLGPHFSSYDRRKLITFRYCKRDKPNHCDIEVAIPLLDSKTNDNGEFLDCTYVYAGSLPSGQTLKCQYSITRPDMETKRRESCIKLFEGLFKLQFNDNLPHIEDHKQLYEELSLEEILRLITENH